MSGGSYDYICYKLDDVADTLEQRHKEPHVRGLAKHFRMLGNLMHAIEWADSGDTTWDTDLDDRIKKVVSKQSILDICTEDAKEALKNLTEALKHENLHS